MRVALTPRPKIDAEAVKEVQTRLQSLGYHLGSIDGSWGPRTRSALRDFQEQAQLPVTGSADEATMGRLMRDDAPAAVTASRDEWTAKDLVESGSKQVVAAQGVKKAGLAIKLASAAAVATEAGSQAIGATDSASNAISGVESAISVAERGAGLATKIAPFLLKCAASPLIQLAGVTALIGFTVWLGGHRVVMNRLRAARTGQHVGV
jgi:peptidoglycan hydrolase-like protein with peptidoglycan-binding domain